MANIIGCSCDNGNGNTGLPECKELFGVAIGFGFQRMVAKDGTLNRIDLSVPSLGTVFSDLITDADKTKRLFPITDIRNVDFPKEDTQYATATGGQKEELRDGIQSVTAEKWLVPPAYDLKMKQMKCNRNGTFTFSRAGVQGVKRLDATDGKYYWSPIEINAFAPNYKLRTDEAREMEMLPFDYNETTNVGEFWMVKWEDLGITYEQMIGLLDANFAEVTAPSAAASVTTIEFSLSSDYGAGLFVDTIIDGQETADFSVVNSLGAPVAALLAVEVPDDKYTLTYTQETPGETMTASMVLASGYEGSYSYVEPA